jgi:hypothetical protein
MGEYQGPPPGLLRKAADAYLPLSDPPSTQNKAYKLPSYSCNGREEWAKVEIDMNQLEIAPEWCRPTYGAPQFVIAAPVNGSTQFVMPDSGATMALIPAYLAQRLELKMYRVTEDQ